MPEPSQPDPPRSIGDPASLFDTDEVRPIRVRPNPPSDSAPASIPTDDGYDLDAPPEPVDDQPVRPVAIPSPPVDRVKPKARAKPRVEVAAADESGSTEFVTEVSDVDPVWTRMGEWGADLTRVAGVGFGSLFLTWLTWNWGNLSLLILAVGAAATVLLSYPLLITLERPVRITPEQAVTDFYAAASHHFPHYRRMWLLLSDVGRRSGSFATFEEFRDYWKGRMAHWRQLAGGGKYTPLKFEVDGFRADKSTGKETSRADYTVNVRVRDREAGGPIESIRIAHGLVKGPDRMWYLNRGVLESSSR